MISAYRCFGALAPFAGNGTAAKYSTMVAHLCVIIVMNWITKIVPYTKRNSKPRGLVCSR